ncbi:MAG TPA: oligopeptide/dipeptide ABC transporter ATP-binding protein [Bacilli bacterium]
MNNQFKEPLIETRKLKKFFPLKKKHIFQETYYVRANEDVTLTIYKGETLGIVGESGCGKSTLGRVILQLYEPTSGSALYYGIPLRELNPDYVINDIKRLPKYQEKAKRAYQKSLEFDNKIQNLLAQNVSSEDPKIKNLQYKSKELKKEASRQLREGSRIAGEFILEDNIEEISKLMLEEELVHREIFAREQEIKKCKRRLERNNKLLSKADVEEERKNKAKNQIALDTTTIDVLQAEINEKKKLQEELVDKLEGYHFKNVLPITERTLDPDYQQKMEHNREYAINLQKLNKKEIRVLRKNLQIIFQDPYSSLDPRMTVGQAISEAVVEHGLFERNSPELEEYIVDIMAKCGLDHYMIHRYPHQFSGGQRQRIVIARALALQPEFIVCDESVSALDVSIQSQILNLLQDLKKESNLTYLFISHDLSVIKHISDRIGVMYLGNLVEITDADRLYENPLHPYSKALISAIPTTSQEKKERIILEGDIPSNIFPPSGCKFRTRCPLAREKCAKVKPELVEVEPGHSVACHFYEETKNL